MPRIAGRKGKPQVSAHDEKDIADSDNVLNRSESSEKPVKGRVDSYLDKFRGTRTGRTLVRLGISVLGGAVVVLGLLLVPLPGPGWLIVFAGLAIWSVEFHWAKRLNRWVRTQVSAWTRWYRAQTWPIRIVVGAATGILVLAIIAGATYVSVGPEAFTWIVPT